jgi:hypothetical protein
MDGYVLVIVKGRLIEQAVYSVHQAHAVGLAEDIWPEMDPEIDDVKVCDVRGTVVWQSPREA